MVTVFTSSGCSYCELVLSYLTKHNIPFQEKNISENHQFFKEWKDLKVLGTPTTHFEGNIVVGFNGDELKDLIHKVNK
ncbi:glutaredoxin family protein [Evansella tamaricis]|uniref:Glutaredoxin family protein n=1 Tax=Evansella tamaricis TaxID=2069301 RepID=A0ABS6J997_9BACI|nr:glutaredoxin family protein [Evansella tamaricis]MBU9710262.1 glutaredoxin family protein [Evansella tamaricis]